ncbi:MAG: TetR/AcrR family transcriptional regulator [Acidimicrobiales bacterium]|nr:TetR/AcrR family transcriptional regulator [Acidimicrobiales bacterium]
MSAAPHLRVVDAEAPLATPDVAERILDATLDLVARWGVSKTALGDVAKEAGCSRATVYRAFPGGKQHLLHALAIRELGAYHDAVTEAMDGADTLADALTRGLVVATRLLRDHAAAQFILAHEPGLVLPFLGFGEMERLYRHTSPVLGGRLARFLPPDRARWAAEWATRAFLSYLFNPDPRVDLADADDARRLVETFVVPAFDPSHPTPHPS